MRRLHTAIMLALASTVMSPVPVFAQDNRPNILLVLFDDVGFMDFGALSTAE